MYASFLLFTYINNFIIYFNIEINIYKKYNK